MHKRLHIMVKLRYMGTVKSSITRSMLLCLWELSAVWHRIDSPPCDQLGAARISQVCKMTSQDCPTPPTPVKSSARENQPRPWQYLPIQPHHHLSISPDGLPAENEWYHSVPTWANIVRAMTFRDPKHYNKLSVITKLPICLLKLSTYLHCTWWLL